MKPQDDPFWPECREHPLPDPWAPVKHWCDFIAEYLREGNDAGNIETGLRYCVPIVTSMDIWAEVSIANDMGGDMGSIYLVVDDPSTLSMEEDLEYLGIWTRGEGRLSMALVLNDWITARNPGACRADSHGFAQEMKLQDLQKATTDLAAFNKSNAWYLVTNGRCIVCKDLPTSSAASAAVAGSFTAASVGLGGLATPRSTNSSQQRTRDLLKNRFGNP